MTSHFQVNFSFISSYIPASPPYGAYFSQLIRYSRACVQYSDLLDRVQMLTQKLLKLSWNYCYKNCTVVITIWWPFRNIHISNDNGSLTFYVDVFFPLSLPRFWPNLTVYMSNTAVSYKNQDLLTIREYLSLPLVFWWGPCCSSFQFSVLCLCSVSCAQCCLFLLSLPSVLDTGVHFSIVCVFTFLVRCCDVRYDFRITTMFEWSLPPHVLCYCLYIVVSNTSWLYG